MGLHIGEGAVEKLPCALDRKAFHLVRRAAALIIALAGISLGIFVGEDRPLGLKHRLADDVLAGDQFDLVLLARSEEHTSELQSLMRISYAVFCSKKKNHVRYLCILSHHK